MNHFKAISLTYKNTPIEVREQLALDAKQSQELILILKEWEDISDIFVLSTCNRTEVYYHSSFDYSFNIIQKILLIKGLSLKQDYKDYFQPYSSHTEAVSHLFEVAMGLESQVVGDMQISNQVKQAYQLSADLEVAGPFLHRLLHSIFFTNKRVVQETPFRSGAASTSYATVELVEEFSEQILNPKVLVLGIGEIGSDVCRNLVDRFKGEVYISNRSPEKAEVLAAECNFKTIPFNQVQDFAQEADIIISSIRSSEPFIGPDWVQKLNVLSFKYFIDLSVPRSIDPAIEEQAGVLLYNIDQINNRADEALEKRLASIPDVRAIVQSSILDFKEWAKEMEISPVLQKLKAALEQIRQEEMDRYARKFSDHEMQNVNKITKSMMQKILKLPALQLKAACKRGEAETLIDVLNDLFNLEAQGEKV